MTQPVPEEEARPGYIRCIISGDPKKTFCGADIEKDVWYYRNAVHATNATHGGTKLEVCPECATACNLTDLVAAKLDKDGPPPTRADDDAAAAP